MACRGGVEGQKSGWLHLVLLRAVGQPQQRAHAREGAEQAERDEAIGVPADRLQQKLVPGEVALAEVELDLRCERAILSS